MKTLFFLTGGLVLAAFLSSQYLSDKPRVLMPDEVPIAFWAWRNQAPRTAELQNAITATKVKTLFLHAGQFDVIEGSMQRIRPVTGRLPQSIETHIVYNGTRRFLSDWGRLVPGDIAGIIADTFRADLVRARIEEAEVSGLQLDFDVPTRLLPLYAETLQYLRKLLPPDTKLSITGLATWTNAKDLELVLANVDFWIPQCYGTAIPANVIERIPISSASEVGRIVEAARKLNKPFYAGLSAYGYAILYSRDGDLVELRGDIDPALAIQNANLELIETRNFTSEGTAGEKQYVYRSKSEVLLDGLVIHKDEILVFNLPDASTLRANARTVRENAGDMLLGICIFRLPTAEDSTTLSIEETAAALSDTETIAETTVTLKAVSDRQMILYARNTGTARSIVGDDALTIDLSVPQESLEGINGFAGFRAYETLCGFPGMKSPRRCSARRANILRLQAGAWSPKTTASAMLNFRLPLSGSVSSIVTMRINDGRLLKKNMELPIQEYAKQGKD